MDLATALKAHGSSKGPTCTVSVILDKLDPEDRATLTQSLEHGVPYATLSRALKEIGHDLKASTIARHKRGDCGCGK